MFHKYTGRIAATLMLLSVSAQPLLSSATEAQLNAPDALLPEMSFADIRTETKAKISDTQTWIKDHTPEYDVKGAMRDLEIKVDRFQDEVKPAGRSMKAALKGKLPAKGLIALGDKTVSVFGLILMMSFALVLLLMGLASPASRLGGRH